MTTPASLKAAVELLAGLEYLDRACDRATALAAFIDGACDGSLERAARLCDAYEREVHDFDSNVDAARTLADRIRELKSRRPDASAQAPGGAS